MDLYRARDLDNVRKPPYQTAHLRTGTDPFRGPDYSRDILSWGHPITSTTAPKMDTRQIWTLEAIHYGRRIKAINEAISILLPKAPYTSLIITWILFRLYWRNLNTKYFFFLPSIYPLCIFAGCTVPSVLAYTGLYITIYGTQFGIPPVLPPMCKPESVACPIEALPDLIHMFRTGGSSDEIWTPRAMVIVSSPLIGVAVLGVLGVWCTKVN